MTRKSLTQYSRAHLTAAQTEVLEAVLIAGEKCENLARRASKEELRVVAGFLGDVKELCEMMVTAQCRSFRETSLTVDTKSLFDNAVTLPFIE